MDVGIRLTQGMYLMKQSVSSISSRMISIQELFGLNLGNLKKVREYLAEMSNLSQ